MSTARHLTPAQIEEYRATARARWEQEQRDLAAREQRAWAAAGRAAQMLKERFGATRVVVLGSLVHSGLFTPWSDVDIAAWSIRSEDTLRAMEAYFLDRQSSVHKYASDRRIRCAPWKPPRRSITRSP